MLLNTGRRLIFLSLIRRPLLSLSKKLIVKLINDLVDVPVNVSVCSDTLSVLFSSNVVFILTFAVLFVAHEAGGVLCSWNWRMDLLAVYLFLLHTLPAILVVPGCVLVDIFGVMLVLLQVLED